MPENAAVMTVSNDWEAAREVQQRFMAFRRGVGTPGPEVIDISAQCRQVQELGGDFYDFMPFPGGRLALAIGDASGKGLAAALMMANVQSSLRTAAWFTGGDGAAAVEAVNRQVHASSLAERYATLFYGVIDPNTRTLRYVNAGHHSPMILHRDGSVTWLETGGAPVGMFSDWSYEEGCVPLASGDLLVVCTDGVMEAVNPAGEDWASTGRERRLPQTSRSAPRRSSMPSSQRWTISPAGDKSTMLRWWP